VVSCACCPQPQLDKVTVDASEFKAGFDKAAADAAEFKAGLDKASADAAEFKAGYDKVSADAAEYKAGYDKVAADAAEFKAGFDKVAADAAEYKAEAERRKTMADTALAQMNRMAEDMSQVGRVAHWTVTGMLPVCCALSHVPNPTSLPAAVSVCRFLYNS
jgi:uncharacterized phage infection (PIP) family protein YhgE